MSRLRECVEWAGAKKIDKKCHKYSNVEKEYSELKRVKKGMKMVQTFLSLEYQRILFCQIGYLVICGNKTPD